MKRARPLIIFVLLILPAIARGDTIRYVDDHAIPGGNGQSWAEAYDDLQDALADGPDEIRVGGGTYLPGTLRADTFQLVNGTAVRGGYRGLIGGGDPNDRNVRTFATVLSGDIGVAGDDSDNSYHVVTGSGADATAELDGVTITGGNAATGNGGGMFNNAGSPTLADCTFLANSANAGGAMYNFHSAPSLTDCTFRENAADEGGGVENYDSDPTLTNCSFYENWASGRGGGMYNKVDSSPTLTNGTFSGNWAGYGGAVCNSSSDPTLADCTFTANSATETHDGGGGMANYDSSPILTNCVFSGNSGFEGGGMYCKDYSSPTLANCTFEGNSAYPNGGGMSNYDNSSPTLINCALSGNSAGWGGAMFNGADSGPTLINCTLGENSAEDEAGGIANYDSATTLANCIVWGNAAPTGRQIYNSNGTTDAAYCCIQDGWPGTGNVEKSPYFGRHHRLTAGSPCIDAGYNGALPSDVYDLDGDGDTSEPWPLDLAGRPRFHDDPDTMDAGVGDPPIIDMGAYEFQPAASMNTGACCLNDACIVATEAACLDVGGGYQGDHTNCTGAGCPTALTGDIDGDCDVDLSDLAALLAVYGTVCE